ncbi:MAG: PHP-associated domain-containing protein [Patescibacteria group bacterium]
MNWYGALGKRLIQETGADGIESFNAAVLERMNRKAQQLADELNLPVTGGSDTRMLENIGRGVTVFSPGVTVKNFQDIYKNYLLIY